MVSHTLYNVSSRNEHTMQFNEQFIKTTLSHVSLVNKVFPDEPAFSVDSRTLNAGEIFVALRGQHTDGHTFVSDAVKRGAAGLIIADAQKNIIDTIDLQERSRLLIMTVPDPLHAFILLATAWRAQFSGPIMAITGSAGKTTTKELIGHIAREAKKNFFVSHGNQNTIIGVSLNIFRLRTHHEGAVFELGVGKRGQMEHLVQVLRPTSAVIINVGHSHMEGIGSVHDIALEKRDIFKYFTHENIGIINGDQPMLSTVSYPHPVIKFGSRMTNQIQARKIRVAGSHVTFVLKVYRAKYNITLNHSQVSMVFNVLAATSASYLLGIPVDTIVSAIQKPLSVPGRFEPCTLSASRSVIIHDAYNANPESMKASLLAFQQMETSNQKIAVLGDMLELGANSPFWHRQLGRFLRKVPSLKHVILVGQHVQWTKKTMPVHLSADIVSTWQEATALVRSYIKQESTVLVKGSHGVGLTKLVAEITDGPAT